MGHLVYGELFNDKVQSFLSKDEVRKRIAEYVDRYNSLLENSTYLKRGVFTHNHAATVRKALADNGFFAASHTISLSGRDLTKREITSSEQLDAAIEEEKKRILRDPELSKAFDSIDREITKNAELRSFRSYLEGHPEVIPELSDLEALQRKLWLSYCGSVEPALTDFADTYRSAKEGISRVIAAAKQQETKWQEVLTIFRRRFSVPFSMKVTNQDEVMLKDKAPSLVFSYTDGADACEVGATELLTALSTGEKRAFYLLNVIFEIEARTREPEVTVLVLDDIADSFDYKNKYAIVEYLKAIHETGKFVMVILTHNFDFFRTVQSRLAIGRKQNTLMAVKSDQSVGLVAAANLEPFHTWRTQLHKNRKLMIASIPMVRNLVEYQRGKSVKEFAFLTSLLHKKPDSDRITMTDLADVVNSVLGTSAPGGPESVMDVILQEAEVCTAGGFTIDLENKVVLSMAIRLLAEELMIAKVNDPAKTDNLPANQTRKLFEIYKAQFPGDAEMLATLDRVMLMTPEAIHLNSFMFEPILDMADGHLKSLYDELKALLIDVETQGVVRVAQALAPSEERQ